MVCLLLLMVVALCGGVGCGGLCVPHARRKGSMHVATVCECMSTLVIRSAPFQYPHLWGILIVHRLSVSPTRRAFGERLCSACSV